MGSDRQLIGVIVEHDDREVVSYFTDEASAGAAATSQSVADALGLAGAGSDLNWD